MGRSALAPLARTLVTTAGRAALQRALPLYMGIGIVAAIVFEGNGMRPATLVRLSDAHAPFRVAFWAVWLLVSTPAARAVLCTPSSFFLRALPIPRARFLALQGAMLLVVELPWLWLWTRGGGPVRGALACAAAVAAHGLVVARPRRPVELAAAAALAGALVLRAPAPWLAPIALGVGVFALRAAWVRAPEQPRGRDLHAVFGPAPVALALAYLASLYRGHGALALRALLFVAVAVAATVLTARNEAPLTPGALATLSLTVLAPAVTIACVSLSGPVLREEQSALWLFSTCGTHRPVLVGATAIALATAGALLGGLHGLTTAALVHADRAAGARLVFDTVVAGAALGALALQAVRMATRGDGRDPGRTVTLMLGVLVATVAAVRTAEEWALPVLCAGAMASTLLGDAGRTLDARDHGAARR